MQPMMRSGSIASEMTPPGSTLSRRVPSHFPPCRWKYHQGMPFWADTTAVSGPMSGLSCGAIAVRLCALTVRNRKSTAPTASGSSVADGWACNSPWAVRTVTPLACIAFRWGPRAMRVTFCPARASFAPRNAPIAPAPYMASLTETPLGEVFLGGRALQELARARDRHSCVSRNPGGEGSGLPPSRE